MLGRLHHDVRGHVQLPNSGTLQYIADKISARALCCSSTTTVLPPVLWLNLLTAEHALLIAQAMITARRFHPAALPGWLKHTSSFARGRGLASLVATPTAAPKFLEDEPDMSAKTVPSFTVSKSRGFLPIQVSECRLMGLDISAHSVFVDVFRTHS